MTKFPNWVNETYNKINWEEKERIANLDPKPLPFYKQPMFWIGIIAAIIIIVDLCAMFVFAQNVKVESINSCGYTYSEMVKICYANASAACC